MKVIKLDSITGSTYVTITLVPRYNIISGNSLTVNFRNESNDLNKTSTGTTYNQNNDYLNLTIDNTDNYFKIGNKYEFEVLTNNEKLYEGNIFCIDNNDSIQNYKQSIIINNKIQF